MQGKREADMIARLLRYLVGAVSTQRVTMWDEIERLRAIIRRDEIRQDELAQKYSPPDHCCPSCSSKEYRDLCAKQDRRRAWLSVLEQKAANGGSNTYRRS